MQRPQVIFLDAVGTLFGVQTSVGAQYARVARSFGVELDSATLDRAFYTCFQAAGSPAFGDIDPSYLQSKEYTWWFNLAIQTFQTADAYDRFSDFGEFFAALYAHFESAEPWFLYPEVLPTLQRWQAMGIPMGIVSNFDSRLYAVLRSLGLTPYFHSITISTEAGVAKPDRRIFAIALEKHNARPDQTLHIGDSFSEDYQAAQAAGLQGIWLNR